MNESHELPSAIFVDDEPAVLSALRRMLRLSHRDWQMHFFTDPQQALEALERLQPWIVFSDRRMPGLSGLEFLERVATQAPETIRVLLTGDMSLDSALRGTSVAHFILRKPFELDTLADVFVRARVLHQLPLAPELRRALGVLDALPVLPAVYTEITRELQREDAEVGVIGRLISQDQVLLSRVLRVVNSPFFGFSSSAKDAETAVTRLGLQMIQHLVLIIELYQCAEPAYKTLGEELMQAALALAERVRVLCDQKQLEGGARNRCILAALLHNIGRLVLYRLDPSGAAVMAEQVPLAGAYLLELWGVEPELVEAVLHQADTESDPELGLTSLMLQAALQG